MESSCVALESALGRRIVVVGSSCAGKSTLGERLAGLLGVPFVELDALHWKPGWQESTDEEFVPKLAAATESDGWVVAGSYHRVATKVVWPRAQTIIWLDLPLPLTLARIVRRSWRRWRRKELLWGTNTEKFWSQFKLWDSTSLITFSIRNQRRKHDLYLGAMSDPQWSHARFVRLRSQAEVDHLVRVAESAVVAGRTGGAGGG
jgi:adenylate kinase family enzyme